MEVFPAERRTVEGAILPGLVVLLLVLMESGEVVFC